MELQEICDTLNAAQKYLKKLNNLKSKIQNALKQVLDTFEETEVNMAKTFDKLKKDICDLLEKRQTALLNEAAEARDKGLMPLQQCMKVLTEKIEKTNDYIELGCSLEKVNNRKNTEEFLIKACFLGSLPEVPELKEVPYISFSYEHSHELDLNTLCSNFGEVFFIAPIQIKSLEKRPGAILVEWQHCINEDQLRDIQEFRLQRAFGDVKKDKKLFANFRDCYRGLESQFLVKDTQISQPYSFRICCKFEGSSEWSPWSVCQVGLTDLRPFSWEEHSGFMLSNENKIVSPVDNDGIILYSADAQVSVKDSVEFTILSTDNADAILGLTEHKQTNREQDLRLSKGTFLLDASGKITVGGAEKITMLPQFTKGLKICFSCEQLKEDKIRVSIDSSDKRVTYDWPVQDSSKKFYFACQLKSSEWKIMVE